MKFVNIVLFALALAVTVQAQTVSTTIRVYVEIDNAVVAKQFRQELRKQRDIWIVEDQEKADLKVQTVIHFKRGGWNISSVFAYKVDGDKGWYLGRHALTSDIPADRLADEASLLAAQFTEKILKPIRKELARR